MVDHHLGRYIVSLNPESFYQCLHQYERIIESKSLTADKNRRLLQKLDEWMVEYHTLYPRI